jgi:hypothetical protein
MNALQMRSGGCWCRFSILGGVVGRGGVKCSCSGSRRFLDGPRESGREAYLSYSHGRRRYASFDGEGVDFGGCWSPGSSPGMIARER